MLQEIPQEELEADDSDKVIGVFHFSKELQRTHGVPFKFVVKRVCPFYCHIKFYKFSRVNREKSSQIPRNVYRLE